MMYVKTRLRFSDAGMVVQEERLLLLANILVPLRRYLDASKIQGVVQLTIRQGAP